MKEYYVKRAKAFMRYSELTGDGTPIIFIHGLGCAGSYEYPEVCAQTVLKNRRMILVDLLGAGYSDKPLDFDYKVSSHAGYLKEFIDDMGFEKVIIFGHSLGGPVSIELARLCGEKLLSVVLSEPNLDRSEEGAASRYISSFGEKAFVSEAFPKILEENRKDGNSLWAGTFQNWLPEAAYRISCCAAEGGKPSWRETLYELAAPKTIIIGEKSEYYDAEKLRKNGVKIAFVANAGHSMAWENPKGLAEAIAGAI